MIKTCNKCNQTLPHTSFHKKAGAADGYKNQCKDCVRSDHKARYLNNREERLRKQRLSQRLYTAKKFGLTPDCLAKLYEVSNGCCEICGITEEDHGKYLAIDHCHKTGEVRGLLCMQCNTALGNFNDDLDRIKKAMEYLQ